MTVTGKKGTGRTNVAGGQSWTAPATSSTNTTPSSPCANCSTDSSPNWRFPTPQQVRLPVVTHRERTPRRHLPRTGRPGPQHHRRPHLRRPRRRTGLHHPHLPPRPHRRPRRIPVPRRGKGRHRQPTRPVVRRPRTKNPAPRRVRLTVVRRQRGARRDRPEASRRPVLRRRLRPIRRGHHPRLRRTHRLLQRSAPHRADPRTSHRIQPAGIIRTGSRRKAGTRPPHRQVRGTVRLRQAHKSNWTPYHPTCCAACTPTPSPTFRTRPNSTRSWPWKPANVLHWPTWRGTESRTGSTGMGAGQQPHL